MRRADREIREKMEIESIIRSSTTCHLALSDGDQPYVVPLNFGYEEGSLYFHSAKEGRKVDIIRRNPRVCFSFVGEHEVVSSGKACNWTARYQSVTGFGTASLIDEKNPKLTALGIIMRNYSDGGYRFEDKAVDKVLIIRVDIESMSGKMSGD
jgi:nitroimidazol reductase NimA-like FMN-containing flavoprotein (pyridoxamine 5'-phosphate oxidase superfamily)